VDQDYLWMSSISAISTSSLMSDFMGYREFGCIGCEARMEGFLRLWKKDFVSEEAAHKQES